ncbi:MAG: proteasome-type protease [Pseudomonadota bacterium]
MTYCVGLRLSSGLLFMADTRTNAGVDNISTFKKMYTWVVPGERFIMMMTAGNLATTQTVISMIEEHSKAAGDREPSILKAPSMFEVATIVGRTLRSVISEASAGGQTAESTFNATMIVGGQIANGETRMFMVYPEGNFIEASDDTPFFQIGETKYGRPILVRAFEPDMAVEEATKLLLVSFDSTIKANLSVNLPLDMVAYEAGTMRQGLTRRFEADNDYYAMISSNWGEALRSAFSSLPDPVFDPE